MERMFQKWNNPTFTLLLSLSEEPCHLRDLSRKTGIPPATAKRLLDTLVSAGILDAKREGLNRKFFIKNTLSAKAALLLSEHYKSILLLEKYPLLLRPIEQTLSMCGKVPLVVLFGSYADFSAKEDSDIDIYIESGDSAIKNAIEATDSRLSVKIGKFEPSDALIKEIIKKHVILKGAERFYERSGLLEEAR
ncbi:MAG: helix-turn-helix domain-containing protein [archaeon]